MSIQSVYNHNESNEHSQNPKDSFILKAMEEEFGYAAAHAILWHPIPHSSLFQTIPLIEAMLQS